MPACMLYIWNRVPALRLLLPLAAGIVLHWHLQLSLTTLLMVAGGLLALLATFPLLNTTRQFALGAVYGLLLQVLLAAAGAVLVYVSDIRNNPNWFGKTYQPQHYLMATLQEPVESRILTKPGLGYMQ